MLRGLTNAQIVIYSDTEMDVEYKVRAYHAGADEVWRVPNLKEAVTKGYALVRRHIQ